MKKIAFMGISGIGKTTISVLMFHALKRLGKRVAYVSVGQTEEILKNVEYYNSDKEYDYQIIDVNTHYLPDEEDLLKNIDLSVILVEPFFKFNKEFIKQFTDLSWFDMQKAYILFNRVEAGKQIQIDKNMYSIPVIPVIIRERPGFGIYLNSTNAIFDSKNADLAIAEINALASFIYIDLTSKANENKTKNVRLNFGLDSYVDLTFQVAPDKKELFEAALLDFTHRIMMPESYEKWTKETQI